MLASYESRSWGTKVSWDLSSLATDDLKDRMGISSVYYTGKFHIYGLGEIMEK